MHYQHTQRFRGADFADYVIGAFDWLAREGAREPVPAGGHGRINAGQMMPWCEAARLPNRRPVRG